MTALGAILRRSPQWLLHQPNRHTPTPPGNRRSPALPCSSISSRALGLSEALMIDSTSWASMYSGSFLVCTELADLFGWVPRGRRLRTTSRVVMMLPPCKKFSERFLQIRAFSSDLRRGRSYGGWPRMQEMRVFSCISPDALGTASRSCRHPTSQVQERRPPVWKGVRRREAVQAAVSVSTSRTGTDRLTL